MPTDLAFNFFEDAFGGLSRWPTKLNDAVGRFGPTRPARDFFIRDRPALSESLEQVRGREFGRIVVAHGEILAHEGPGSPSIGPSRGSSPRDRLLACTQPK